MTAKQNEIVISKTEELQKHLESKEELVCALVKDLEETEKKNRDFKKINYLQTLKIKELQKELDKKDETIEGVRDSLEIGNLEKNEKKARYKASEYI